MAILELQGTSLMTKMEALLRKKLEALYLSGEREIYQVAKSQHSEPSLTSPSREPPLSSPVQKNVGLQTLRDNLADCRLCRLCEGRKNIVFGVGSPHAKLMFVGEAPGRDEDLQGEPFVGRAGQLLNKIIEAMGLNRESVYIANVVKCRPPENRNPAPDEISTCEPFLLRQIELIRPKVIVCLGTFAAQTLLMTEAKITSLRGVFQSWPNKIVKTHFETPLAENSILVMPTYHPAFLLRNPNMKRPVWEDMQKVRDELKK